MLDSATRTGFCGAVSVHRDGSTVLREGVGLANIELGVPNTPSMIFRIGSVSKQFTAVCILLLQDRCVLRTSDTVGEHLPDAPDHWKPLTIHQLLTHTSGLMHSWNHPNFAQHMAVEMSLDENLARFHDEPLVFEPGAKGKFQYTGVGYFLLARLVEVLSGHTFPDFLRSEVLGPLGLHDTGCDLPELVLRGRASGYEGGGSGPLSDGRGPGSSSLQPAPPIYMPILTGGGSMYSTVDDLQKWDEGTCGGALLSDEGLCALEMAHVHRTPHTRYGYGWQQPVGSQEGLRVLRHGGGLPGFTTHVLRMKVPERRGPSEVCVCICSNVHYGGVQKLADELAKAVQ